MIQELKAVPKKVYTPIQVSLLGSISELTESRNFSGPGGGKKKKWKKKKKKLKRRLKRKWGIK